MTVETLDNLQILTVRKDQIGERKRRLAAERPKVSIINTWSVDLSQNLRVVATRTQVDVECAAPRLMLIFNTRTGRSRTTSCAKCQIVMASAYELMERMGNAIDAETMSCFMRRNRGARLRLPSFADTPNPFCSRALIGWMRLGLRCKFDELLLSSSCTLFEQTGFARWQRNRS